MSPRGPTATGARGPRRAERAAPAAAGNGGGRDVREILTPEGLVLPFRIASAGERLGAYLIDLVILVGVMSVAVFLWVMAGAGGWLGAVWILVMFLLWNGYFLVGELGPSAATFGKRRLGLRVMDVEGGVLTPEAVVARNLMRNLEFTVPLVVIVAPEALWPGAPGWARLVGGVWAFALAGMPLFNRWRLRPGDLVGGTLVVRAERTVLLAPIAQPSPRVERAVPVPVAPAGDAQAPGAPRGGVPAPPAIAFTDAQLDVYGVYELQVLEDLLRRERPGERGAAAHDEVARRIAKKIDYPWGRGHPRAVEFLLAFYTALRDRLERRMLLGRRKEDKWSE